MTEEAHEIDAFLPRDPRAKPKPAQIVYDQSIRGSPVRILLGIAAFFAAYHLVRLGDFNFTLADMALCLALGIATWRGELNLNPFAAFTPLWYAALAMMLGGIFLGSIVNGDVSRWLVIALQYMVAFLMLPAILTSESQGFLRRLIIVFLLGVTVIQILGGLAWLMFDRSQLVGIFGPEFIAGNGRVASFAGESNWNGAMIAFALPMLIYGVAQRLVPMLAAVVIALLLCWGLILAASFTGVAAAFISSSIMLSMAGRRAIGAAIGFAAVASALVASGIVPMPQVFQDRVGGAISSGDMEQAGTYTERAELIEEAWGYVEDYGIVGMGADQFREHSPTQQPVHNLYMLMWTEGGIFALVGLLMLHAMMIIMALGQFNRSRPEALMALAIIAVFSIYTMASPHMFHRMWAMPLMLVLGQMFAKSASYPNGGLNTPKITVR